MQMMPDNRDDDEVGRPHRRRRAAPRRAAPRRAAMKEVKLALTFKTLVIGNYLDK
jgi:hypothetical protein